MEHQSESRALELIIRYQDRELAPITLISAACPQVVGRAYLQKVLGLSSNTLKAVSQDHFTIEFAAKAPQPCFKIVDHSSHGTIIEASGGNAPPRHYQNEGFSIRDRISIRLKGSRNKLSDNGVNRDVLIEMIDSQFRNITEPAGLQPQRINWQLLLRYLSTMQTVHITGLPGIGKNWLASQLVSPGIWQRERTQQLGDVLTVWVDGAAVAKDEQGFWRNLAYDMLLGLRQALVSYRRIDIVPEIDKALKYLRGGWVDRVREITRPLMDALRPVLREANLRPLFIFDNFDHLYANLKPGMLYKLYQLHHEQHDLRGKISFVLITRDSFAQLREDTQEREVRKFNSLFQGTAIELSYLQPDEFNTLLIRLVPGQNLAGTKASHLLYDLSGGHPALTKELCKWLSVEGILNDPHLWHDRLQKMDWTTQIPAICEEIWLYLNPQQRKALADYAKGKLDFHKIPNMHKMNAIFPQGQFFSPIFKTSVLHWGQEIQVPGLRIDPVAERIFVHGKDITDKIRNRKEFGLLFYMYQRRGELCTYKDLWRHSWPKDKNFSHSGDRPRIQRAVNRLCGFVDPDRNSPKYIFSKPGQGYILEI